MREALSGTSSQRFTVPPASISIFWGLGVCGLVGFLCLVWGFWFCVGLCLFLFVFPPRVRSFELCANIVCNLERPSELSWRARHGRKKTLLSMLLPLRFVGRRQPTLEHYIRCL